jgi:CDP-diacylglycerol--serine O-phosphatidyltransferase
LLTLGNAVCGFVSIALATQIDPLSTQYTPVFVAALPIFLAMLFDVLDGHVARWAKQTSEFGAQLDSLCDVISFGVAPAFLMLKFRQVYHPRLLLVIAILYLLCTVMRLARFNVETDEESSHEWFTGLPSPAAAGTLASFAIAVPGLTQLTDPTMPGPTQVIGTWLLTAMTAGLPIFMLMLACLMVSKIRYPHVINLLLRGRRNFQHLLQLVFAMMIVSAVHELAIPVIFGFYAVASPVRALRTKLAVCLPRHSTRG